MPKPTYTMTPHLQKELEREHACCAIPPGTPLLALHRRLRTENQRVANEQFCDIAPLPCIHAARHLADFIAQPSYSPVSSS